MDKKALYIIYVTLGVSLLFTFYTVISIFTNHTPFFVKYFQQKKVSYDQFKDYEMPKLLAYDKSNDNVYAVVNGVDLFQRHIYLALEWQNADAASMINKINSNNKLSIEEKKEEYNKLPKFTFDSTYKDVLKHMAIHFKAKELKIAPSIKEIDDAIDSEIMYIRNTFPNDISLSPILGKDFYYFKALINDLEFTTDSYFREARHQIEWKMSEKNLKKYFAKKYKISINSKNFNLRYNNYVNGLVKKLKIEKKDNENEK